MKECVSPVGHRAGTQEALNNEVHTLEEAPSRVNLWDPPPGSDKVLFPGGGGRD